jgi:SAM-dependent methyltransferase
MSGNSYLHAVREQYEVLPYPPRDPELERTRLIQKIGDNLIVLNHHCYSGARDFSGGFRVLVAGGGTGDSTLYLAEQLRDLAGEVVYLDLSAASMAVARARADIRGLTNIRWINDSILNIPSLGLGTFDYISCTGVLHHLESTEAGLAVLAGALKDDGVILLMLYGKYGRRSVYDMQALLRTYLPTGATIPEQVRLGRQLLTALPASNSFMREFDKWRQEISDDGFGDAGFYDLLLHSQDRCFDVPELYQLARSAGMDILGFVDRAAAYEPANLLAPGPVLNAERARLAGMDLPRRQAIAEQLSCDLSVHEFYVGRPAVNRAATLADHANTVVLMGAMHGKHAEIAEGLTPGRTLTLTGRCGTVTVVGTTVNRVLFRYMDGVTPISRMCALACESVPGATLAVVQQELQGLFDALNPHGHLYLLRQGSYGSKVPDYSRLQPT